MPERASLRRRRGVLGRADLLESLRIENVDWFALPGPGDETFGYQRQRASPALEMIGQRQETQQSIPTARTWAPLRMESCWAVTGIRVEDQTKEATEDSIEPAPIIEPVPPASPAIAQATADFWTYNAMRRIWPRRHPALRNMVSPTRARRMAPVNWPEVTRRIARGKSFWPLPRRNRLRWPGNLVLVLDYKSRSMAPLVGDMIGITDRLRRIIGDRAVDARFLHADNEAAFQHWNPVYAPDKQVPWRPLPGELMLVVSDLATAPRDQQRRKAFSDWLRWMAHGGSEVVVLSPIQPPTDTLPVNVRLTGWSADTPDSFSLESRVEPPELQQLLALVALIGLVPDVLLRALAELVKPGSPPLGLIWSAWNHQEMITTTRYCWLSERGLDRYRGFLGDLPVDRISQANEIRRLLYAPLSMGNEHLTVLRMDRLAPWAFEVDGFARARAAALGWLANELPQKWLHAGPLDQNELADQIARIIEIAHPEVRSAYRGAFRRLQRLAMRDALARGESIKSYPELGVVKPDSNDAAGLVHHWKLLRSVDRIRVAPADTDEPGLVLADTLSGPAPGHAVLEVNGKSSWVEISDAGSQWIGLPQETRSMLLRLDEHEVEIDQLQRPTWAAGWAHTENGLSVQIETPWSTEVALPWPCPENYRARESHDGVDAAFGKDGFGLFLDLSVNDITQRFRWIEPGEFLMGSPKGEPERLDREGPQHRVRLIEGFWLADSACTQALWLAVLGGENPSYFKDDPQCPVEQVSWDDVQGFLKSLGEHLPSGARPGLPTEAQWEYACRAGTGTPFSFGENITPEQVNYDGNYPYHGGKKGKSRQRTVPVKSLPPNRWGLYEMHGNVWEWCADGLREYEAVSEGDAVLDPEGPSDSSSRALRGGSWLDVARSSRSAGRDACGRGFRNDFIGFRLALRSTSTSPAGPEDRGFNQ